MSDDTQAQESRLTDKAVALAMGWTWYMSALAEYRWLGRPGLAKIAEWPHVREWTEGDSYIESSLEKIPTFSADAGDGYAAMQEMLAWIESKGWEWIVESPSDLYKPGEYLARAEPRWDQSGGEVAVYAPSMPLAVCRLVLALAKGEEKP